MRQDLGHDDGALARMDERVDHHGIGIGISKRANHRAACSADAAGTTGTTGASSTARAPRPASTTRSACSSELAHACLLSTNSNFPTVNSGIA
jgi:hypothetical protein